MVIRIKQTTDFTVLDNMVVLLDQFPELIGDEMQSVVNEFEPQMLEELRVDPGPVKRPIDWTRSQQPANRGPNMPDGTYSKQKAAYFATDGFGGGIPSKRTGGVQKGWQGTVERGNNTFSYAVENTSRASRWVYGSLAQNVAAALRFQQPFHRNTGWLPGTVVVQKWLDIMQTESRVRVAALAETFTKRRAFTSKRKR